MKGNNIGGQALRYLLVGGMNTVVTYGIFVGLGLVIPPPLAFTVAYLVGLLWVVFGSAKFVFRADRSPKRLLLFAAWYVFLYGVGQLVVQLISPSGVVPLLITSLAILLVTTPLSFLGGRFIFQKSAAVVGASDKEQQS